ncbi:hypothetical protein GA0115254_110640 [Streptomyces sp. Ncost-T10-10d]|nr:hypothetical protein GA0115254_110640 [Streptomyces sp. Ncost-T10-10d]
MRLTLPSANPPRNFRSVSWHCSPSTPPDVELDATWTVARAGQYYRSLPQRARRVVKLVVARGGYAPADDRRDDKNASLCGHNAAPEAWYE